MVLPPKSTHPKGEWILPEKSPLASAMEVETYGGKIHVEWDPTAAVTPIGQLAFFIEFLKLGGRFDRWVNDCPSRTLGTSARPLPTFIRGDCHWGNDTVMTELETMGQDYLFKLRRSNPDFSPKD